MWVYCIPVAILQDTGASQSLLLEGTLPLSGKTFTGAKVLIPGVELEPISVPLHEVELQSDIVSGLVQVGVRPSLPVTRGALILVQLICSDLASQLFDKCVTGLTK